MKKILPVFSFITFIICLFLLLGAASAYSQTVNKKGNNAIKWKAEPFNHQVFIENNGQFDGKINSADKILYGIQLGKVNVYFTRNKVIYRYDEITLKDSDAEPDDVENIKRIPHFLSAEWSGANPSVSIEGLEAQRNYYTYPSGSNKTIKATIFKQIIYKNIYAGIDAVYQFIKGKAGIKYSLVVHPGADITKIKINYSGAKRISKNDKGDIIITGEIDTLTDHAPLSYTLGDSIKIPVLNSIGGNTESFVLNKEYDKTKTIVIDPWVTDPLFVNIDAAYDLGWDYMGNVYAYGAYAPDVLQLTKIDKNGVQQWTYNAALLSSGTYGGLTTDKVKGTSYMIDGATGTFLEKVNTDGMLVATGSGNATQMNEQWRIAYDECNNYIVIAGGGTFGTCQAQVIDTSLNTISRINVLGTISTYHDMALLAIDPNGTQCYMATSKSYSVDPANYNNVFMQLPVPSISPTAYLAPDGFGFNELHSVYYAGTYLTYACADGMNGAVASRKWLYLYNGDTLKRFNKNTGALSSQLSIRTNTPFQYGGLDVDPCDNLYVGVQDSIYILDSAFAIKTKIPLPNTVYAVQLGKGNAIYACGEGYVTQLINPYPPNLISTVANTPSSCSVCNGKATVNVNCGLAPFTFNWSDGSTNQTDSGLCAGSYTVTVQDGTCPPYTDTAIVNISTETGFNASFSDTNPGCTVNTGNITVYPSGGNMPYTYLWSNGATTQNDTGVVAGIYTCFITDNIGCKYAVNITLPVPAPPEIQVVPGSEHICHGDSITLTAYGGKKYKWTPSAGVSCDTCPSPKFSPPVTTVYTVTGTDSAGCSSIAVSTITLWPPAKPVITGIDSICSGWSTTLIASGGNSVYWSPGPDSTAYDRVSPITTTTYTATVNNGYCSKDTTYTVYVFPYPAASAKSSVDSICSGDSVLLTGSGGKTYKWSNGSIDSLTWVNPTATTTYTLHVTNFECTDSTIVKVNVFPPVYGYISTPQSTICPFNNTVLDAINLEGPATYKWSTGATTSSITVNDSVSTIYTVTFYGKCDSTQSVITLIVIPLPKPVITGDTSVCQGKRDTLTVKGGRTYLWNNASTGSTFYTYPVNTATTVTVVAYNSIGCADTAYYSINVKPQPNITFNKPNACSNSLIILQANVTGAGTFSYLWSPGGETTDTISTVVSLQTINTVTISNACQYMAVDTIAPDSPVLNVCCDATILLGDDTTLSASGSKNYLWSPNVDCLNPPICDSVKVNPTTTTTYTVTGIDSLGCDTFRLLTVIVELPCLNFNVPNVFTPNRDGINEKFEIDTPNPDKWSIIIYDRWGKEMFKTIDLYHYWDGVAENGKPAPDGVYYYIIEATCQEHTYKKEGFVQLIR